MSTLRTALALAAALAAPPAGAQQLDRRAREQPEIVVEAGGRVGTCDVLRFSADGKFLLAAGDDKVVRVWPHTAAGIDPDRARTLRWRAWREQRGGIKAFDVSPDGRRVVVGGYGMKPSTVAVLDRVTGNTLALSWPAVREGDANFNVVTAVAFGPGGRVGFGTADGSLWLWDPAPLPNPDADGRTAAPPRRVGRHEVLKDPDGRAEFNFPRLVFFPDQGTLASVAHSGQLLECALEGGAPDTPEQAPAAKASAEKASADVNADQPERHRVYRAERIDGGRWLVVASVGPQVLLRSADGKTTHRLELGNGRFARSVAWHPKTRQLAVGVGRVLPAGGPRFHAEADDEIWVYANPTAQPGGAPRKLAHRGPAEALAFHPSSPHLAVAGGPADEVTLLALDVPEKPLSVARGAGRRPWAVNISDTGNVIGVRVGRDPEALHPNERGAGAWTRFDVKRLKATRDDAPWVNPLPAADGWSVAPDKRDSFVWYAARTHDGKEQRVRLGLDRHRDGAPTCFTFLPATAKHPLTRLIVGHYYGCTLFELDPARAAGDALRGAKVFTGHAGEVLSVVAAKDQTWFVTGGADQTVAAWSLRDWKGEPNLGARFEEKAGAVRVAEVAAGSPAWEAGLRAGTALDLLAVDGRKPPAFDRRGGATVGTVQDALAALKAPRPRVELFFGVAATEAAPRYDTLTTVRQRPLWKWFPAFDGADRMTDWAVWMWHGSFYHTKTAHGDRLVGWHVNAPGPGGRPEFYQLHQFEKQFHRPEVLEKLSATADAGAALVAARGETPTLEPFTKFDPAPVRVALGHSEVPPAGLPLTVTVQRRGSDPDLLPVRVELWLNDYLAEVWPRPGARLDPAKPFEERCVLAADRFRAGDNRVTVLAFNALGGRAEEAHVVHNPRAAQGANLLGVLSAVNDYSSTRRGRPGARDLGDLRHARDDAAALGATLEACAGPKLLFREAKVGTHTDPKRATLAAALAAVGERARPDDTLVVFFAGHGDLLMPKDGPLPPGGRTLLADEGVFLLCCPDYTPLDPASTALAAEELFAALAKVNCRKVVLLDACHSGRAAAAQVLRRCVPAGQGPLVIAACDHGERSYESPKYGHGVFTFALLDALDKDRGYRKADADSDGALSAAELFDHVAVKVPDLLKRAELRDPQTPVCFPRQLPTTPLLKR